MRLKPGTQKPEEHLKTCTHLTVFKNGKYILQQYRDKKAQSTKVKLHEKEQEFKEVERKERKKFEEQIANEKLATEKALWMEQRRIMFETKEKELEMERKARAAMATYQS